MNDVQRIARTALLPLPQAALNSPSLQDRGLQAADLAHGQFAFSRIAVSQPAQNRNRGRADSIVLRSPCAGKRWDDLIRVADAALLAGTVRRPTRSSTAAKTRHPLFDRATTTSSISNSPAH